MNEQQLAAMKQALEALKECRCDPRLKYEHPFYDKVITDLEQVIAQDALDWMAKNARELGLSYDDEPKIGCVNHDCDKCKAVQEPEYWNVIDPAGNIVASETDAIRGWARIAGSYKPTIEGLLGFHDQGWRVLPKVTPPAPQPVPVKTYHDGKPWPVAPKPWVGLSEDEINKLRHLVDWTAEWSYGRFAYEFERLLREKNAHPQSAAPEFYHHVVENEGDWSEWVNPDNDSYMMKCCDCGLVHEMQFKVAKYSDGDECEFVGDPDLQPVFRARRAEEAWQETDTPPAPQPVPVKTYHDGKPWPVAPKPWVGLTDEEFIDLCEDACNFGTGSLIRHIEAKLKEKNT